MDQSRLKQLAGLPTSADPVYTKLMEVAQLGDDLSLDDLISRLDACKRALSIVAKMDDPADKKKWMSATFVNLNKVSAALQKKLKAAGFDADDAGVISGRKNPKLEPQAPLADRPASKSPMNVGMASPAGM